MSTSIRIRHPELKDCREFLARVRASRELHSPWVAPPSTTAQFTFYIRRIEGPGHVGFLVCRAQTGAIAGVININNIVLGLFRSVRVCRRVIRHAFRKLKLHCLEANIQPDNVASIALVRSLGFSKEGYSPRYLKISGRWRDHERWAIRVS